MQDDAQYAADVSELLELLRKDKFLKDFRDAFSEPEDLEAFAAKANFYEFDQGTQVIKQGDKGTSFFIIMDGQMRAIDVSESEPRLLNYLTRGAIVGTRALLSDIHTRTATVEIVTNIAKIAVFSQDDWYWLIGKNSRFEDMFQNLEQARIKRSNIDFPGRQWDEVVVAATKRHFTAYIASIHMPVILLMIPVLFFLTTGLLGIQFSSVFSITLVAAGTLFCVGLAALLAIYNYFDWRNDDFIVTTKRVVHIERILFFGEQREDAPLTRIQDVTLISDVLDLIFDSDTLRITTAGAGIIEFNHIREADHIRSVIFTERERAKARVAAADVAALRKNIAHQIHWEDELEQNVIPVAEAEGSLTQQTATYHYNPYIDYFIPRIKEINKMDDGSTIIIWRKHYYVLLTNIFLPFLAMLAATYFFLSALILWIPPFTVIGWPLTIALGVAVTFSYIWYLAKYDDWHKDVYIVTNTQIIDIESAAFRIRKTRREGTFDNIQGVYSEIPNIFYKLINLGDVIIETAGTEETFTFRKVFNPASVREEVFNRWAIYQQREREAQRDATNKQVMEVLKEYHKLVSKAQPHTPA